MENKKEKINLKTEEPLISIVIPVYNTEKFFDRCITSVLNQSYSNLEVIIVNDGSTGNITELINNYSDNRIHFVNNEKNQGLLRTRVCGANIANGEYIAFIDSDDYISFDFYRTLLKKALETDADIVIGKTVWDDGKEKYIYNFHESCFCFDMLEKDNIKKAFFGQQMQCYSWHTIWNKLYKKELWDKCSNFFNSINNHIVMTEDIYFSSLLFYNATKVSKVENDAYFYCANEGAATNSSKISFNRFRKNISDMVLVFDEVEKYLKSAGAKKEIFKNLEKAREHYGRMWDNLATSVFDREEYREARKMLDILAKNREKGMESDCFFESKKTIWKGKIEYIKEKIARTSCEYVSFDIFDTLVVRDLFLPSDLFLFMNSIYAKKSNSNVVFSKIRKEGEELARKFYGERNKYADITIDEIYKYIETHYGLKHTLCEEMKNYEKQLEIGFAQKRKCGKELLELAIACGKKVVLITDMYLDRKTLLQILEKCEIKGYERIFISSEERKLKYNGELFERVLNVLGEKHTGIMHVGDTWEADIEGSGRVGIESIFLPKAKEVFENKIKGCETNRCSKIGEEAYQIHMNYKKWKDNLGIRCMLALVYNKYFDNPYRCFEQTTDFNMDAYFMGYYLLGMHMLGVSKWLKKCLESNEEKKIIFLGRDGYIPWKIFELYSQYYEIEARLEYIQASRRALMPMIIRERVNFYQMPIEIRNHTPETMYNVLEFAIENISLQQWNLIIKTYGIEPQKRFQNIYEYHAFIDCFLEKLYSAKRHDYNKKMLQIYYSRIDKNDMLFDMGYSGRIHAAICDSLGHSVNAMFIHEDYENSVISRNTTGYKIESFYNYSPKVSGLFREHIFSSTDGSCIAFDENNGKVEAVIEEECGYSTKYIVECIQKGAQDFVEDFLRVFAKFGDAVDFSSYEASIPFEGFLICANSMDLSIFAESYFEDIVYGASRSINIKDFLIKQREERRNIEEYTDIMEKEFKEVMNANSQWKRMIIWLLVDFSTFKEKVRNNIQAKIKRSRENGF